MNIGFSSENMVMNKNTCLLLVEMLLLLLSTTIATADKVHNVIEQNLMTVRDIKDNSFSNITIQNKAGKAITVYGLYVNQFADNTPLPHDCRTPRTLYVVYPSVAAGAFVSPIALTNNQKIPIGKNYLYNMIYTAIYYGNQTTSGAQMPCTLPGCSWPGNGSSVPADQTGDEWCIFLGILAPAAGNSTTSSVPPMANLVRGTGYNYDLVTQYGYIGPISCDDQTLTCSVSRAQNVAFPQ